MGAELGRISGPLLAANLVRHGIDLAFETDLLYLDVNNGYIGIKTYSPGELLDINGTARTSNLIANTQATLADLKFVNNRIQNDAGSILISPNQLLDPTVVTNDLQVGNFDFSNRSITNLVSDSNTTLASNGMGRVLFNTDTVNVFGNLHATGNITFDGNIIIGDSNTDSVDFNADLTSNIIPDISNIYDLGSAGNEWKTLYSHNVNTSSITASTFTVNDVNLLLSDSNIWYVSINGSDLYYGNHERSTFKTIKKALSVAQPGDTVVIFPGTYEEEFPLTVPQGVAVNGASLRSTTVIPTEITKSKDAFLLNGESTVENITVKDFFYDSINDTGYAFRFAPDVKVTTRSPYIRNVTVITKIDTLPAGRGALVDGSVANSASREASMLFHAVTLIVPNANAVTATNGSRVEWLNSFTYFANIGIHLTEGTLGFASQGVKFGAEMRSINSANIYGNYGAIADGPSTLGYLIGHNFGYVGSGSDSNNDPKLAVQANEVVEYNSGKIYFDSVDHKGDFRIGDIFYVNQQTGQVSFDAQSINFAATGNIVLEGPTGTTFIDATQVLQTNLKFYDNNIDSLAGPVNIESASDKIYLNTNVFVTGNAEISADVKVSGNVYLGNEAFDTVKFVTDLTQTIKPNANNTFTLGTKTGTPKVWRTSYLSKTNIDDVLEIDSNTISTISGNLDLSIVAAGTGKIHISSTDVQINNNLTVNSTTTINGLTTLQDYEITGNIHHVGNFIQTGNTDITGDVNLQNLKITGVSYFDIPNIRIYDNIISATQTNDDLLFVGNGATAGIIVEQNLKFFNETISNVALSPTTDSQKSIIFSPNGTGNTVINSTKSVKVPVGNSTNKVLSNYGELRQNSTSTLYEAYLPTGVVSLNSLYDADRNTYITPELTPGTNDSTLRFGINGSLRATITSSALSTNLVRVDNLDISGNTINNYVSGDDMYLIPTGTGILNLSNVSLKDNIFTNATNNAFVISITGTGYVKFNGTSGIVIPTGTSDERRLTPELGEVRHNTTIGYMEVWNGSAWIPAVGTLGAAPLYEVLEIMDTWSLILG